jgi:hypothetical protein
MNNTTINLDKLRLTLYYDDASKLNYYLKQSNKLISATRMTVLDKDKYKYAYVISFDGVKIGTLLAGMRMNKIVNHLSIYNHIFYTHQSLFNDFLGALNQIEIDIEVSCMEVAVDSDSDIFMTRYNKLKRANKLVLGKTYISANYSVDVKDNKFIKNAPITQYIRTKNKVKKANIRLENKTKEILDSDTPKNYITDYHKKMGLDVSKDIHRFELVIPNTESLNLSISTIYVSKQDASKSITSYKRDVLVKTLEGIELRGKDDMIFDSSYLKTRMTLDEYSIKKHVKTRYDIDITLLCNQVYLQIIFSTFSKSVIQNIKAILKNNIYVKEILKTKKMDMIKIEKQTKLLVDNKVIIADALSDEMGISFDDALRRASEFINASNKYKIDIQDMDNLFESI